MSKLDKSTVALTFKFDCDRFLRYRLATRKEIDSRVVPNAPALRGKTRPGINLITAQGRAWEASCYDDIVREAPSPETIWEKGGHDEETDRFRYAEIKDLLKHLQKKTPPKFIIEAEFAIPGRVGKGLDDALKSKRLDEAKGRPDLIWIQPFSKDIPLIKSNEKDAEFIIHVFDIKLAAEPSLRHFVEVTFYALGLQAWLEDNTLADRYAVCAQARVWPGTHEASSFRSLVAKLKADGVADPLKEALLQTTSPVPFEVYKPRLQSFIDVRLPAVLNTQPLDARWHVSKRCQLCDFFDHCVEEAKKPSVDHLAQIGQLTAGHSHILKDAGIGTVKQLTEAIDKKSVEWLNACAESHALRAMESTIRAQTEALATNKIVPIPGRRTVAMPKFANLNIFITAHFDPGTGITFAFGARKVHFIGDGTPPSIEEVVLPIDSIDAPGNQMSPKSEGDRLAELCEKIKTWLEHLDQANKVAPADKKQTAHFFVWDQMEARQLARVVSRHLTNEAVMEQAGFLLRVFPPENELRNAEDLASQPLTIVKSVIRNLLAIPVPFEFTLMDVRNIIDPYIVEGQQVRIQHPWGFQTPMSDQIPLERAYEVWQNKPMLKKYDAVKPYDQWSKCSREEIRDGIKEAIKRHLTSIGSVVSVLQREYRDMLLLRKEPFALKDPPKMQVPLNSAMVYTLERLSSVAAELESREILALPVEEREANFHSIRGLTPAKTSPASGKLAASVRADDRYSSELSAKESELAIFEFSENSRDTRLRDGSFLVVLRNEECPHSLETRWYRAAGYDSYEIAQTKGLQREKYREYEPLKRLLQVTIARIDSAQSPPLVAVIFNKERINIAKKTNIADLTKPLVLDPIFQDFSTELVEKVVRRIGGKRK